VITPIITFLKVRFSSNQRIESDANEITVKIWFKVAESLRDGDG